MPHDRATWTENTKTLHIQHGFDDQGLDPIVRGPKIKVMNLRAVYTIQATVASFCKYCELS